MGVDDLEVLQISALYRNDQPGGVGVALRFAPGSAGVDFCHALEASLKVYDRQRFAPDQIFEMLAKHGRERPDSRDAGVEAISGIHWLQERDYITADEFNGPSFCCVYRGDILVVEENPVLLDMAAVRTSKRAVDVTEIFKASMAPGFDRGLIASVRAVVDHAREKP